MDDIIKRYSLAIFLFLCFVLILVVSILITTTHLKGLNIVRDEKWNGMAGESIINEVYLFSAFPHSFIKPQVLADISGGISLECLINCESGGDPTKINWNDGGSPSYGLLQFKKQTFKSYCVDKYKLKDDIMSGWLQRLCAEKMLEEKNGWRHWYNCYQKCQL